MMNNASLVLEGGGMRGVYTAGVLDFFLEKNISFSSCYGVSAGVCTLSSFLAGQKKRAFNVMTNYLDDKRYMGIYSLLTTGDLFNAATSYTLVPEYLDPVDYETFSNYKGKAFAVMTNMITGEAEYYQLKDLRKDLIAVRASSSLPLVSRPVYINHIPYLDGGISDGIPITRSIEDGNQKNVVIMTKDKDYIRKPTGMLGLYKCRYALYPNITRQMETRHTRYNMTLEDLKNYQDSGQAFIIRPSKKLKISRTEKNADKLKELYQLGWQDAEDCYIDLMKYLKEA